MFVLVVIGLLAASVSAAPGYPGLSFDDFHGAGHYISGPALLPAPTIIKTAVAAPAYAPAPIYSHGPVYAPAPVYAHAPAPTYIKTAAPVYAAPIVKAVGPATSYATVTQVHVTHPQIVKVAQPIIKTVVAAQPVLKSYALPAPEYSYGNPWGYH